TVRAAHILLSTRDAATGQEVSEETKKERRQQIDKVLERAKKGEEFAALAREYSEDPGSKNAGGEYTFARGQFHNPEFESAAFALKTNEISGVITTAFGYHILKLYEKMPAQKLELAKVKDDLKDGLSRREVQEKLLPDYLKGLKKQANLQYLNGAKPPPEVSDEKPADKPVETPPRPSGLGLFGLLASLLTPHRPLRVCSSLAPRQQAKWPQQNRDRGYALDSPAGRGQPEG